MLKKIRFRKILFIFLFTTIISLLIYYLYSNTDIFLIQKPIINYTNTIVNKEEIEESINNLKYFNNTKYFDINSVELENEIYKQSPFIDNTIIVKEFPNKISIYLKLKQPILSLEIEQKRCVLLDDKGFVLKNDEEDCKKQVEKYNTIYVKTDDPKLDFTLGSKTVYTQLNYMLDIVKVFNNKNIPITQIIIEDNVAIFVDNRKRSYVFSFNQEIKVQLSRLLSVFTQLSKKDYEYTNIDVRFNRPILINR